MSKSSVKGTFAQAKQMGLELSSDGKSWVPIEELVVKLPPSVHKQVGISVNKDEGGSTLLKMIISVIHVAVPVAIFSCFIAAWLAYYILLEVIEFLNFFL